MARIRHRNTRRFKYPKGFVFGFPRSPNDLDVFVVCRAGDETVNLRKVGVGYRDVEGNWRLTLTGSGGSRINNVPTKALVQLPGSIVKAYNLVRKAESMRHDNAVLRLQAMPRSYEYEHEVYDVHKHVRRQIAKEQAEAKKLEQMQAGVNQGQVQSDLAGELAAA